MIDQPIQTEEFLGCTIEIYPDECPVTPRDWANYTTIHAYHPEYNLADHDDDKELNREPDWEEFIQGAQDIKDILHWKPLYLKRFRRGPKLKAVSKNSNFNTSSKMAGFAIVLAETAEKLGGMNKDWKEWDQIIDDEIEVYSKYLRGDVEGYKVVDSDGEEMDSCWGYFDRDHLLDTARAIIGRRLYHQRKRNLEDHNHKLNGIRFRDLVSKEEVA